MEQAKWISPNIQNMFFEHTMENTRPGRPAVSMSYDFDGGYLTEQDKTTTNTTRLIQFIPYRPKAKHKGRYNTTTRLIHNFIWTLKLLLNCTNTSIQCCPRRAESHYQLAVCCAGFSTPTTGRPHRLPTSSVRCIDEDSDGPSGPLASCPNRRQTQHAASVTSCARRIMNFPTAPRCTAPPRQACNN